MQWPGQGDDGVDPPAQGEEEDDDRDQDDGGGRHHVGPARIVVELQGGGRHGDDPGPLIGDNAPVADWRAVARIRLPVPGRQWLPGSGPR